MPDAPATYTYVMGQLSWLLDYGEQIADPNVIITAKDMCEEVRELEAAHKAVEKEREEMSSLRLAVAMLAEATAQEVPNRLVPLDEPSIDALRINISEMATMIRAFRERALVADRERDEALLSLRGARDARDAWTALWHDNNAALAAICDLLGIDYHRTMERGQDNPPAAIVEAVRNEIEHADETPDFWDWKRSAEDTTGLALWRAARERMQPPTTPKEGQ